MTCRPNCYNLSSNEQYIAAIKSQKKSTLEKHNAQGQTLREENTFNEREVHFKPMHIKIKN